MRKRRNFSRDFKLSVLTELQTRKPAEICREHNLHPSTIQKWKREFRENPKEAFNGNGNLYRLEAKLAERERVIGELYLENQLLKKTISRLQKLKAEEEKLRCIK